MHGNVVPLKCKCPCCIAGDEGPQKQQHGLLNVCHPHDACQSCIRPFSIRQQLKSASEGMLNSVSSW